MVVLAHPDDETVGASTLLARLTHARFVFVTDGAPGDGSDASRHGWSVAQYRDARRRERDAAFALCGLDAARIIELDCPDQQAALQLAALSRTLAALFDEHGIGTVLTHAYEGGHPDHDATTFIVHAAARLARDAPSIMEMPLYRRGPHGPVAFEFLADEQADAQAITVQLSPAECAFKQSLIDCYSSQRDTLAALPVDVERFRPAPSHDFRRPPHEGLLWYEERDWNMTGGRFCELADEALRDLGLS
jgi:N-acetylglucosamine malate deacetylase 2